jgi:DNA-binding Lrp family transcriptional regulator
MLRGDLSTMPLSDLLQWVDASRKSCWIEIEREANLRSWLVCVDRQVIATAVPVARGVLSSDGTPSHPGPGLRAVAIENLLDLFFAASGTFQVHEATSVHEPGVPIELSLSFLVMEALRQLDEWPRIEASYPSDASRLRAVAGSAHVAHLSVVQRAIHRASEDGRTLGEVRVVLGLSRHALLRRVDELASMGLVEVEGMSEAPNLPQTLLTQARALMRERQFAEAAYVMRSLLATDPGDERLRRLLEECEKRHVADCYEQFSPTALVRLDLNKTHSGLGPAEQAVVDLLASKARSVAGLVLSSPLRELDTLVALQRLGRKQLIQLSRSA